MRSCLAAMMWLVGCMGTVSGRSSCVRREQRRVMVTMNYWR